MFSYPPTLDIDKVTYCLGGELGSGSCSVVKLYTSEESSKAVKHVTDEELQITRILCDNNIIDFIIIDN